MSLSAPASLAPATFRPTAPPLSVYFFASLAYVAAARISAWGTVPSDKFTPVWLGTGLSIWLMIRFGPRMLISILIGEIVSNALDYTANTAARDLLFAAPLAIDNILTAYVGALLWHRGQERWRDQLGGFYEPLCCVVAALVAPLVAATFGVSFLVLKDSDSLHQLPIQWLAWWTGDAISALFLLPVLLTAPALWQRLRRPTARGFGRGALLLGLSAAAIHQIFGASANGQYLFALFPLLAIATVWFGAPGARLLAFLLAIASTYATRHGRGPFPTGEVWTDLLTIQLFLSVLAVIALLLPVLHARKNLFEPLPRTLLLSGWALSGLVFGFLLNAQLRSDAADFAQLAANAETMIENRIVNYVAVLRSAQSYVLGAPAINRASWQSFVQSLDLPGNYPGLKGVGLVYPVAPTELDDFLARVRADRAPDFALRALADETLSSAQPHFVLTHLERVVPTNQELRGIDVGSQPLRRRTLETARDTGQPKIAPHINRTHERSGFSLYLPVYGLGAPINTVEERQVALRAWVHAGFGTDAFIQGVLGARRDKLHFYLFAPGKLDAQRLLYSTTPPGAAIPPFDLTHSRQFLGQEFTLAWNPGPAFVRESRLPLMILAVNLAIGTVLLTGWVLSLQSFRERAEALVTERTTALFASENRYRLLNRSAKVGLWDWNLLTGELFYSPEWKSQLGYADHELPSQYEAWESRLHPEDRIATLAAVADFQAGRRPKYEIEFRLLHRDGSWRWILTQAELAHDETGRIVHMIGSHIDITARKAIETALRASDQRFHELVNSTDGIVWEADAKKFIFTSVSTNAERLLGYPISDWLQPGFWQEHIHPEDREQAVQIDTSSPGRSEGQNFEYRFTTADGRVVWLRDIVRIASEDGQPSLLRGLMIDITEQRTATNALLENQALLLALTESTSDSVYVKDLQGRYLLFNTAACRYAGKSAAEILGRDDTAILSPEDAAYVMTGDQLVITSGRTQTFEEPNISTALGVITFLSTKGPIRDAKGNIVGMFGVARDITARKQAEQALLRTSEMLERTGELGKIGGWSMDLPATKLTWTRETFRITEIEPPIEPPLAEAINLFAPEARPTFSAAVQAAIEHGTHYDLELPVITAKGNHRWVHTQGFAESRDGVTIRIYGTFQDITAQKQVQLTLLASEERFRTLVEHSPYCIHEINVAGRLTSMNRAGLTMMGVPDFCAIQDLPYLDTVGPRDRERIADFLAAAIAGRAAEFTFKAANGSEFQSSFVPIKGENGIVQRLIGLTIDITSQTQASNALRMSEAKLRALVAAIPDLIFEHQRDGKYLAINAANSELLLASPETLLGYNMQEFLPAPIAAQALGAFGTALDTGKTQMLHYTLTLSGKEKHFESRIAPCTKDSVLVIVREITDRKLAEAALRSSEAKSRAIINASPVPMALNDDTQRITFLNPAFTRSFGYGLADIPTLSEWWERAYPDPAYQQWASETWQRELARSTSTGTDFSPFELTMRCKDGTNRVVSVSGAPLKQSSSGENLVVLFDITQRKHAELSIQSNLAEKTALLKEVHHRVKNNLQVITSLLRLEGGRSAVPDTKAVLTAMQSRIRAMALLHESLYQTGTFAAVDLGAYLRNIATQVFRMLNTAAGNVRLTHDLASIYVEMDQAAPSGLLVNELISNCLKHGFPGGRGGEVRISLLPVAGSKQVCLRVSDDGIGLPSDFETKRGTSLGLQLVSDLAEQLNGHLEIGPVPVAEFTVTFTPVPINKKTPA